jgi:Protein of unknown function (DUF4239)
MLANWIYSQPNWLVGGVTVGLFVLVSWLGLALVHRFVPVKFRRQHNEIVGFTIAVVGVVYAVLLAFIAVTTWESFRKGDNIVVGEANYVGDVFRNTVGLPDDLARGLRQKLDRYIDIVITQEWPDQQAGRLEDGTWQKGWDILAEVHADVARFRPANAGEAVLQAQLLRSLNNLYDARRGRLLAAADHVTPVVWWIVVIGALLTVSFSFLFGPSDIRMHAVVTGLLAGSLAVVVVLIVVLDYPFRGTLSVSDEAFRAVQRNMEEQAFQRR